MEKYLTKSNSYLVIFIVLTGVITAFSNTLMPLFAANTHVSILMLYQPLTALFLHYSYVHWCTNMFYLTVALYINHKIKEPITGIIPIILIIGSISNLFGILAGITYNFPSTYIIGASGGIFGLIGYVTWKTIIDLYQNHKIWKMLIYLSVLGLCVYSVFDMNINAISNTIHASGFTIGLIYSIATTNFTTTTKKKTV